MSRLEDIPEPWRSFLREIDEPAKQELRLECMGGFVVTQLYGFSRPTSDIDTLSIIPREQANAVRELGGRGGPLHAKYQLYLDFVTVDCVPENYEERLTEMYPGALRRLRLFALDPYDIALSKLERNIQRDRDDVRYLARVIPFDLAFLRERYEKELRWQLGNPAREDLTLQLWIDAIEEERAQQRK
jgi:hypothetical protein